MMIKIKAVVFILLLLPSFYNLRAQNKADVMLYIFVDKLPHYGDRNDDLFAYIYNHLEWPSRFDGDDRILISFIVTKDGKVEKVRIEKALCKECGEAIKNLFEEMPLWSPGEKDGESVNVKIYLPIDLTLK